MFDWWRSSLLGNQKVYHCHQKKENAQSWSGSVHFTTCFLKIHFILFYHLNLGLSCGLFSWYFPIRINHVYYVTKLVFYLIWNDVLTEDTSQRPHGYSEQPVRNPVLILFVLWTMHPVFNFECVSERWQNLY